MLKQQSKLVYARSETAYPNKSAFLYLTDPAPPPPQEWAPWQVLYPSDNVWASHPGSGHYLVIITRADRRLADPILINGQSTFRHQFLWSAARIMAPQIHINLVLQLPKTNANHYTQQNIALVVLHFRIVLVSVYRGRVLYRAISRI